MTRHDNRRGGWRGGRRGGPQFGPFGPPMGFPGPGMRFRPPMGFHGPPMGPMGFGPMMGPPMGSGPMGTLEAGDTAKDKPAVKAMQMVTHQAFDPMLAQEHFIRATPEVNDEALTEALLKRTEELTPNTAETQAVQNLVGKVEKTVESLILTPEKSTEAGLNVPIEEVRIVGSHKKGTMLAGHPVADLVVILKDTPSADDIENLSSKVQLKLKEADPTDDFPTQANEGGFNTTSSEGALVRVLVTTLPKNLFSVDPKHVDVKLLEGALATIRHARWFEENASHMTVRVVVRILKDMKKRFTGLSGLTPWLIDLLAFRSSTLPGNTRDPLPLSIAFRRAMQLMSAGIFLPGSLGIVDPCESGQVRAHSVLSLEEQDQLSLTAQTILRTLSHGAFNAVLGIGDASDISLDTDITSWAGVVVTPGQPAYDKEEHKKESIANGGGSAEDPAPEKMEE